MVATGGIKTKLLVLEKDKSIFIVGFRGANSSRISNF